VIRQIDPTGVTTSAQAAQSSRAEVYAVTLQPTLRK
jgi:hypothetical protein